MYCRDEELERSMQPSQSTMTWVSAQMMRDRDRGEFENYGERLYVEGLLELERKKALVRGFPSCARQWVLHVSEPCPHHDSRHLFASEK